MTDTGRSASRRATHEPSQSALSRPSVSVPNAATLVRLMTAWGSLPASKFHRAYPFFEADRQRVIRDYGLMKDDRANLEACALLFAEYADNLAAIATEARRAETTGSACEGAGLEEALLETQDNHHPTRKG